MCNFERQFYLGCGAHSRGKGLGHFTVRKTVDCGSGCDYFSKGAKSKDGEDLPEACYDCMVAAFQK